MMGFQDLMSLLVAAVYEDKHSHVKRLTEPFKRYGKSRFILYINTVISTHLVSALGFEVYYTKGRKNTLLSLSM